MRIKQEDISLHNTAVVLFSGIAISNYISILYTLPCRNAIIKLYSITRLCNV